MSSGLTIKILSPVNDPKKPKISRKYRQQTLFETNMFNHENKQLQCEHKFIYGPEQGIDEHPERICKKCGFII
tara:strand:- start:4922 stop:5140 length:219 start_codon:yes stop_codon:yes gene_type:complete